MLWQPYGCMRPPLRLVCFGGLVLVFFFFEDHLASLLPGCRVLTFIFVGFLIVLLLPLMGLKSVVVVLFHAFRLFFRRSVALSFAFVCCPCIVVYFVLARL
jgi:hypothetical protein